MEILNKVILAHIENAYNENEIKFSCIMHIIVIFYLRAKHT